MDMLKIPHILYFCLYLLFVLTVRAENVNQKFIFSALIENDEISNIGVVNDIIGVLTLQEYGILGAGTRTAVIEGGTFWKDHIGFENSTIGEQFIPTSLNDGDFISEHMTFCASIIGGHGPIDEDGNISLLTLGIAPKTEICSGSTGTATSTNIQYYYSTYKHFFEVSPVDVISTSSSPIISKTEIAQPLYQALIDAFACRNTKTTFVAAAGNDGPDDNTICHVGLNYNGITVGALTDPISFDSVADFSSRGASDFYNPKTDKTLTNVRAGIDILAPGDNIAVALYDSSDTTNTDTYTIASGTSFAAPIVAGTVSLLVSLSKEFEADASMIEKGWSADARDSRVIKAVLLNSATKIDGWDNGQAKHDSVEIAVEKNASYSMKQTYENVIVTSQSLDYASGAGALNAEKALEQYIDFSSGGWILDDVALYDYDLWSIGEIEAGDTLTATLVWMIQNSIIETETAAEDGTISTELSDIDLNTFADLNLEIWRKDDNGLTAVALSNSIYNNVEHLHILIEESGDYYIRVFFEDIVYGDTDSETYALAFSIVPEPAIMATILGLFALCFCLRNRK